MTWRLKQLFLFAVTTVTIPAPAARRAVQISSRSAFTQMGAERADARPGTCLTNGDLACADGGDFAKYEKLDFGTGGASALEINLAVRPENANQPIEIRIDTKTGAVIGVLKTVSTNGLYAKQRVDVALVKGIHDVFLVFPGSRPTGPIDTFKFIAANTPGAPVNPPVVVAPAPPPVKPPVVMPVPSPTVPAQSPPFNGRLVTPAFFGMHVEQQFHIGWPTVPFGIQRAWGIYPAIGWDAVNTSDGVYNWTNLDAWVADSSKRGVELVYVLAGTPAWASVNPTGECGGMPRGTCYPAKGNAWVAFISQVSARYRGKIKYFELWNEPDASDFWRGTPAELAAMAKQAYPILSQSGATVLSPSPQGKYGPTWMENYLKAGGVAYADVNAFHAYLYDVPESLTALVQAYRVLFAKYGIGNRPLWDTEHSWGEPDAPMGGDLDSRVAWLARFQILSVQNKIDRSIWYGWEHDNWGTLFDKKTKTITKVGLAYGYVYNWLVNATLGECAQVGTLYQCPLLRPGGGTALLAWSTAGTTSMTVPSEFKVFETLDGTTVPVAPGSKLSIGPKAILLHP